MAEFAVKLSLEDMKTIAEMVADILAEKIRKPQPDKAASAAPKPYDADRHIGVACAKRRSRDKVQLDAAEKAIRKIAKVLRCPQQAACTASACTACRQAAQQIVSPHEWECACLNRRLLAPRFSLPPT